MGKPLSRAHIIEMKAAARKPEIVNVPEWGGDVLIRVMSGAERDAYEAEIVGNRAGKDRRINLQNMRAKLVARCIVNEDGTPMFNWRDPADVGTLGDLDARGLDTVFKACQRINGLSDDDVDELAGNSKTEANGVSGSH